MRGLSIVELACWLAAPAAALAQSAPIVVPPAPPLVAAPAAPQVVQPAPAPQMPAAGTLAPDSIGQSPPASGGNMDTGSGANGAAAPAAAPATAPAPAPPSWLPGTTAQLGVLNEVDGSVSEVQIPVGGQARIGDLQVNVLACLRRPPDQLPDAAAFIAAATTAAGPTADQAASAPQGDAAQADGSASDQTANVAGGEPAPPATIYRGWMLRSAPGAAIVGDAAETFRIIDCD